MKIFCPDYYNDFVCIAGNCPDSCCKEWSVDIDSDTAAFYRRLPGTLGDKLRQTLQDTENGTVMVIENGRCPMWQQDGLCQIQKALGHDALCRVCREFPRLRHDYGSFVELGLELSCPEAARLILTSPDFRWAIQIAPDIEGGDYDKEAMLTLIRSRREFLQFLDTTSIPFPHILTILLLYAHAVQEEIDGGIPAILEPERYLSDAAKFTASGNIRTLQDYFMGLEILTPQWKNRLNAPAVLPQWDNRHKMLLGYFLCRYWLQAIADYDILCRTKFAIAACLLISYLSGDLIETAQLFSKEIENDPDNVEAILDGAYTAPALTDLHLLGILRDETSLPKVMQKIP